MCFSWPAMVQVEEEPRKRSSLGVIVCLGTCCICVYSCGKFYCQRRFRAKRRERDRLMLPHRQTRGHSGTSTHSWLIGCWTSLPKGRRAEGRDLRREGW